MPKFDEGTPRVPASIARLLLDIGGFDVLSAATKTGAVQYKNSSNHYIFFLFFLLCQNFVHNSLHRVEVTFSKLGNLAMAANLSLRLRIAGIYYERSFNFVDVQSLSSNGPVTIRHLLELAAKDETAKYSKLQFSSVARPVPVSPGSLTSSTEGQSIVSFGVELKDDITRSLGSKIRRKGFYQLAEFSIPFGVVAWQYYIYDNEGKSVSQRMPIEPHSAFSPVDGRRDDPFKPFNQATLLPGYQVIWRQVAILREPIFLGEDSPQDSA